ncbi:GE37468 family thiazolyl peptide [Streptosporangium sp. NBC_01639]|uniref:thiomuracin/GE37468 family thiazolyl RiPP peptide n=1 Tax=Streptosporangium sp. NBC_01639 TaxID=2975948 RepID=UPI00386AB626|nr:GE37468 family thiazolyl peptide [Streptosporangium sp. NBC_01639]
MSDITRDLADLPVDSIIVTPVGSLESLTTGHGISEIGASCAGSCSASTCACTENYDSASCNSTECDCDE